MISPPENSHTTTATIPAPSFHARLKSHWVVMGLLLGLLCGVLFGDYCEALQVVGRVYIGLLQMTVMPYLILSLVSKMGRLNANEARRLGLTTLAVLLVFWSVAMMLVVLMSAILPPMRGASFFSPSPAIAPRSDDDVLSRFIPANIFYSLSNEYVPAVVVFSLFFGIALILVPSKEPLLRLLDVCSDGLGRINGFLIKLAPIGLFALTAAATGTIYLEELSRLQGYLISLTLACFAGAFGVLPLLMSSLTSLRYRDLLRVAREPLLTVIATGKLFVVLPQIIDNCEQLLKEDDAETSNPDADSESIEAETVGESTSSVVVPLAYPFPHIGKILAFVFITFAAWYSGDPLTPGQSASMVATGTLSSFASPLVTMPYLLDQHHLPQDLMTLFILPGFITMRLGDVVGVMHLMTLTLIVSRAMQRRLRIRWRRFIMATIGLLVCLIVAGAASRWYLASTSLSYDLDQRLLSLETSNAYENTVVFRSRSDVPNRPLPEGSTLQLLKAGKVLRVGYHPDHVPYSFFNRQGHLVGMDVELMHRLAARLQIRLEFIPYDYSTVVKQLDSAEIDVALGGLMMTTERLLLAGFTQSYQTATSAVVVSDYRRGEFDLWDDPDRPPGLRLGVVYEDMAAVARRELPGTEVVVIDSVRSYFQDKHGDLDGLIIAAEEGAAWNVLYPEYSVVVPKPILQRPIGMAVRPSDAEWLRFLDHWLDFERFDGEIDRLRVYWVEGGGTKPKPPRWCVLRNVLGWLP